MPPSVKCLSTATCYISTTVCLQADLLKLIHKFHTPLDLLFCRLARIVAITIPTIATTVEMRPNISVGSLLEEATRQIS